MAQVFLSYSREDRDRIKPLVDALEAEGISVWWDRELVPGDSFEQTIDREITLAQCIVVAWSDHSIESQWVKNEALEGMDRDVLVPLRLDDVRIPVAFRQTQGADFTQWPETVDEEEYRKFVDVILGKLNRDNSEAGLKGIESMKPRGRRRFRRKRDWVLPGVVMAAMLAVAVSFIREPLPVNETTQSRLTIIPFSTTEGEESRFYADSMTSELVRRFSGFDDLRLVGASSVWDIDLADVPASILDGESDFSLSGTVAMEGDELVVDARLRDVESNQVVWEAAYREGADNLLELQKAMVMGVVGHLKLASADKGPRKLKTVTANKRAYRDYLRGTDLLRRGEQHNISLAIEKFESALARDPDFAMAEGALCRAFIEKYVETYDEADFDRGKAHCDSALMSDASQADVQHALAELYRAKGETDTARYHYTQVLDLDDRNAEATIGLAAIFYAEGDFQTAEEFYQRATRLQPTYWKAQNALGSFYFRQGLYYQAIESYLRVTQLTTVNATAFNNLGAAQFYAGHFDNAYESWRKASDLYTDSAAYSNMGTALYLLGRFEEALAQFETAIQMDPTDHRLWGNAADNMRFIATDPEAIRNHYEKAIELAETNLSINANDPYTMSRLAVYHAALENDKVSREFVDEVKKLAADDINLLYDLGVASILLGSRDAARSYLHEALDAGYPEILLISDPQFRNLELFDE